MPQSKRQEDRAELKRQLDLDKSANPEDYSRVYIPLTLLGVPTLVSLGLVSSFNENLICLFFSEATALTVAALVSDRLVFLRRLRLGRASRATEQTGLGELQAEPLESEATL